LNKSTVYVGAAVVFVVCVAIGVYYLIPGINHVLASPPQEIHVKHAVVFFGLAIVFVVGARFAANALDKNA
jgi:hypothetical protein